MHAELTAGSRQHAWRCRAPEPSRALSFIPRPLYPIRGPAHGMGHQTPLQSLQVFRVAIGRMTGLAFATVHRARAAAEPACGTGFPAIPAARAKQRGVRCRILSHLDCGRVAHAPAAARISCLLLALAVAALCNGCARTIRIGPGDDLLARSFGLTTVRGDLTGRSLLAYQIRTLGAGSDAQSVFVGWNHSEQVRADPAACQLIVIVRSDAALESARPILEDLKGSSPCIADFTPRPSP